MREASAPLISPFSLPATSGAAADWAGGGGALGRGSGSGVGAG